jgi:cell division protein FtsI/penicillin-binding protein 2
MRHPHALLASLLLFTGCVHTTAAPVEAPQHQAIGIVDAELTSLIARPEIRSARIVVVSVATGEVLAASGIDRSGSHPELATEEVRTHGSAGKPLTLAAAIDAGTVRLSSTFPGTSLERDGIAISDHALHETMSLEDVLTFSSNVATTQIGESLGSAALVSALGRFHLGHRVPDVERSAIDFARLAFGAGLETTSVELAQSYAVLAHDGTWPDGTRAVSSDAARTTMALLTTAVFREDGTGHRAAALGLPVAGKTGTVPTEGGTFGVFVGVFSPDGEAHYVVLVGIESSDESYSGGTLAAPSFVRVASGLRDGQTP